MLSSLAVAMCVLRSIKKGLVRGFGTRGEDDAWHGAFVIAIALQGARLVRRGRPINRMLGRIKKNSVANAVLVVDCVVRLHQLVAGWLAIVVGTSACRTSPTSGVSCVHSCWALWRGPACPCRLILII